MGVVLLLIAGLDASAQSRPINAAEEEPQVLLSVDVGYNTAYRDGSWVPVDILVVNEQDDIKGWVEVQTFDALGQRQAPVYRVPADCPKDSTKHFRILAWLNGTERIDAWVYEGNRPAVDVPAYVQIQPVAREDLLVLVLDSDAANLGFLYAAVQREGLNVRLHRHTLLQQDLARLPEFLHAYEVFDAIVLNETDPTRIGPERRELLRRYVEAGGTMIVHTGLHAARVGGTWLDGLTGVEIGETAIVMDEEIVPAVFADGTVARAASAQREGMFAELRRRADSDGGMWFGEEKVLAVEQPRGDGRVYTLAIDASTNLLQDHPAYQALWREMLGHRKLGDEGGLRFENMALAAAEMMPRLSGVTIRPVGFIAIYLALYIGVMIILNWLFWNWRQRRELAWLTLLIASIGFCAFAVVYGSAGWAESSELHRISILEYGKSESAPAHYTELAGVLTARSSTYRGPLRHRDVLARDGGARQLSQTIGRMAPAVQRSFTAVQGPEPWVEAFRVGASELRLARFEEHREMPGRLDGRMYLGENRVRIEVRNGTGLALVEPQLLHNGVLIPLEADGDGWSADMPAQRVSWLEQENTERLNELNMLRYGLGPSAEGPQRQLRQALLTSLISVWSAGSGFMDPAIDTRVFAWLEETPYAAWQPEGALQEGFGATLFVAPVTMEREKPLERMPVTAVAQHSRNPSQRAHADEALWQQFSTTDANPFVDLIVPPQCLSDDAVLHIEVMFMSLLATDVKIEVVSELSLGLEGGSIEAYRKSEEIVTIQGQEVTKRTYEIHDPALVVDAASRTVRIKLRGQRSNVRLVVAASCAMGERKIESGEWRAWP